MLSKISNIVTFYYNFKFKVYIFAVNRDFTSGNSGNERVNLFKIPIQKVLSHAKTLISALHYSLISTYT